MAEVAQALFVRFFDVDDEESNQAILEQTKGKTNQLARQFNCSMTYVQTSLYRKKPAPGEHPKSRKYFLKMQSRADVCINVQIKDGFLAGIKTKQIENLPENVEIIETYGSP